MALGEVIVGGAIGVVATAVATWSGWVSERRSAERAARVRLSSATSRFSGFTADWFRERDEGVEVSGRYDFPGILNEFIVLNDELLASASRGTLKRLDKLMRLIHQIGNEISAGTPKAQIQPLITQMHDARADLVAGGSPLRRRQVRRQSKGQREAWASRRGDASASERLNG